MSRRVLPPLAAAVLGAALAAAPAVATGADARVRATPYVTGLDFPVALAVVDDDTLLVTEKAGAVRLVRDGVLAPTPVARFEPYTSNEAGLLGITLTPDFATTRELLVLYTPAADLTQIRIARLRLTDAGTADVLADPWITLPSRRTDRHYSGNLRFSPDGKLFVTLGDLRQASSGQDPDLPGSILRFEADGSIPADNPFGPTSAVFALGVRNAFDLAISRDGRVYVGENGGDTCDEVNHIERGKNYGWPLVQGYCDHFPAHEPCADPLAYEDPLFEFRQVIGASGITVYEADRFVGLGGDLLVTGYHSKRVHRLGLSPSLGRFVEREPLFELDTTAIGYFGGGMVDVEVAPDGSLFALASGLEIGAVYRLTPEEGADFTQGAQGLSPATPAIPTRPALPGRSARVVPSGGCHSGAPGSPPATFLLSCAVALTLLCRRGRRKDGPQNVP